MEYLSELSLFFFKVLIAAGGFVLAVTIPMAAAYRKKAGKKKTLKIEDLQEAMQPHLQEFQQLSLGKKAYKAFLKKSNKEKSEKEKKEAKAKPRRPRSFVISFKGDKSASSVENLRDEISFILNIAKKEDEVILLLESPGGLIAPYGLAASQLLRLRENNIPLTVCVDTVAASGGYLMACVGQKILAAPFAFIGSIGVIFQMPNLYEFLKKRDIDFKEITAGKHKRTLTPFGPVTEEKEQKLKEQIQKMHDQFKLWVKQQRPGLDFSKTATGEAFLGREALELRLVDKIQTSDDYIMQAMKTRSVYKIAFQGEKSLLDKLFKKTGLFKNSAENAFLF